MKYGYARVSTDGQSVGAQVRQLTKAGCKKVFREVARGAETDRTQLRRLLDQLEAGYVLTVTRLDRLARSTRDLLNTLATITGKKAGIRSLGDAWADTTTSTRAADADRAGRPRSSSATLSGYAPAKAASGQRCAA
jgi:DNA invertase Pin-like site-specific DNA recombinase